MRLRRYIWLLPLIFITSACGESGSRLQPSVLPSPTAQTEALPSHPAATGIEPSASRTLSAEALLTPSPASPESGTPQLAAESESATVTPPFPTWEPPLPLAPALSRVKISDAQEASADLLAQTVTQARDEFALAQAYRGLTDLPGVPPDSAPSLKTGEMQTLRILNVDDNAYQDVEFMMK